MSFNVSAALRKSTSRAKSDVANKLVSMFLHEVSRKACVAGCMNVSDSRYSESVVAAFGENCLYCGKELTPASVPVVEHLKVELLYRDCQRFATDEIAKLVAEVNLNFVRADNLNSEDCLSDGQP